MANSKSINLPYPVSANRYWRTTANRKTGRVFVRVSEQGRQYKKIVGQILTMQRLNKPTDQDFSLILKLHPRKNKDGSASKTVIDLDNALKVTIDSLQGYIFNNDNQIKRILAEYAEPKTDGELSLVIAAIN